MNMGALRVRLMGLGIKKAVEILRLGGLVAFPTETVYGLGADAANEVAIHKIFKAKERPLNHPLIIHISNTAQLQDWAQDISTEAFKLAESFWPGPLTLILKKQPHVSNLVTADQETVGLRIPKHPIAQELLRAFRGGIAAPSANRFTHLSPTQAADVREELGDKVDLILDGGACEVGLESTIIDVSGATPCILRPGMISAAQIADALQRKIEIRRQDSPVRVPGMHHVHYAPRARTVLVESQDISDYLSELKASDFPQALLLRSQLKINHPQIECVQMPDNSILYAHDLYHTLRTLDHQGFKCIVIEAPPVSSDWDAIRDRLQKASGSNVRNGFPPGRE